MLNMLPEKLWTDPNATFLDPCCKSGVFLREIAKRLIKGTSNQYDCLQDCLDHIFKEQIYGIAITEITSLLSRRSVYCSKYPNGVYSIVNFENSEGRIHYTKQMHTWKNGRCVYCGASEKEFAQRDDDLDSHAYEFIHVANSERIFNMKFDVIIGNPPYQLNDGGGTGSSAKPIYQYFVEQAKKMNPRYLSMIIPARWYSGGKGLDKFRQEMLSDRHLVKLVDYENFKDVFPGVDLAGGACYFLWDRNQEGPCEVTNFNADYVPVRKRELNQYDTFIRSNAAIGIVEKIQKCATTFLDSRVSSRLPFGITTTYKAVEKGVPCYFTQSRGLQNVRHEDINDKFNLLDKWKFLVPKAPIAGQTDFSKPVGFFYEGNTRIAKPGEACSESWLVAGAFSTEKEAISFKSYILTKTVRFLLLQSVVSQNITKKNYAFIPDLELYDGIYTDSRLCEMWNITDDEWQLIDSRISEIGANQ